jgi:hypothetical protein
LSKTTEKQERDDVTKRLDAIIRLLMEDQIRVSKAKKGELLLLLDSVGLTTGEIGPIVGRAAKDVASDLRKLKGA